MNSEPMMFRGYEIREQQIKVLGRDYCFIGPGKPEALLEAPTVGAKFAADGYMPYWAEFWPASLLLIDAVAEWGGPDPTRVPRVLELGCGLGAISIVLASLGYSVIASDYDEDALAFTEENARRNGVMGLQTRLIDWRETYPELNVDRIIAAEVLYERRNLEPVALFVRYHLDAKGFALICDRNRTTADDFPKVANGAGLSVRVSAARRSGTGQPAVEGRFFEIARCDNL